ncbi:MAG: NosD domain-containing protein [bacterium]
MRATAVAILMVMLASVAWAETFRVPVEDKDLTVALSQASYGDTILVFPGKYKLQARLKAGVKLMSVAGPESTTLWSKRWHVLKLNDCDLETEIRGFTFDGVGCSIAIACTLGTPTIVGNVIRGSWDGISLQRCNAFVKGNTIEGCNRGIAVEGGNPEIIENTFAKNGDDIYLFSSSAIIARCKFTSNGKALYLAGYSYPTVGGSLTAANDFLGSGYALYNDGRRVEGSLYTNEREVAVATHNYWGSLCPEKRRFLGDVVFSPWANAAHDTTYTKCPPVPAEKAGDPGKRIDTGTDDGNDKSGG